MSMKRKMAELLRVFNAEECVELTLEYNDFILDIKTKDELEKLLPTTMVTHSHFECSGRSIFTKQNKTGEVEIIWLGVGFTYSEQLTFEDESEILNEIGIYTIDQGALCSGFKTLTLESGIDVWYSNAGGVKVITNIIPKCEDVVELQPTKDDSIGMKFDDGKLLCMALPAFEHKQILEVLTNGAKKYKVDNWKHVDDGRVRYMNGLERHFLDYKEAIQTGNNELKFDNGEGGMGTNHLANLICNAIFLLYFDNNNID